MADSIPDPSAAVPSSAPPGGRPAPHPKRAAHLAIFVTVLIDLIGFGILIPIIQPFAQQFGASDLAAQWLMGIYSLMQFLFSPVLGLISDRVGRRPVIIASLLGSTAGYLIIAAAAFCSSHTVAIALLFAARVVTGICGASVSTAQAYLADITAPEKRAGVMGMIGAAFGIGFVLGPVIGGLTSHTPLGPSVPFYVAAALSLGNAYYCWKKLPESLPPEKRGLTAPSGRASLFATMRRMRDTTFPAVLLSNFLVIFGFSVMTATLILWTVRHFDFSEMQNGLMFGFIGLLAAFIQGGLIRRIAKHGRERSLAFTGCVCMAVSLALLSGTQPWTSLLLVMALMATGNSLASPTLNTLASQCGSIHNQGETMGAMAGAGSLGRFIGPFTAGILLFLYPGRYEYAFWLASFIMVLACVSVLRIRRVPVTGVVVAD